MERLRRLRGLFGLSVASALAWIPLGLLMALAERLRWGRSISLGRLLADAPLFAAVGLFCGFCLGLALAAAERKRTFESLSFGRFVALGAASALVVPATATVFNLGTWSIGGIAYSLAMFGIPGGLTAAALLSIARRAPPQLERAASKIALDGS